MFDPKKKPGSDRELPNFFDSLKILALHAIKTADSDYSKRSLMREFSRRFHVPLTVVEQMPLEEWLTHYFEDALEQIKEGDDGHYWEVVQASILETREEAKAREIQENKKKKEDEELLRQLKQKASQKPILTPEQIDEISKKAIVPFKEEPPIRTPPEESQETMERVEKAWDLLGDLPDKDNL